MPQVQAARRLSADGYDVIAVARRQSRLEELKAQGCASEVVVADLAEAAGCLHVEERLAAGGIDLLVNNAGGDPLREFHTMTIEENLRTLQLNLVAPLKGHLQDE